MEFRALTGTERYSTIHSDVINLFGIQEYGLQF